MRTLQLFALVLASSALMADTLTTSEAAKHIGERETVCGRIAGQHTARSSRGTPTFINLDKAYPHQLFTLLIWGDDQAKVGEVPVGGRICATGVITEYHGSPEIVLRDAHSWYVPK